jgi:hypothetical protein
MPKLLESNRISLDWADILNRKPRKRPAVASKRSAGVHLSGIISHCLGLGKDENEEEFPLCMAMGMAWEDWAVGLFPEISWQPGEQEKDGVFATPDGGSYAADPAGLKYTIEEFKLTWQSRRTHGQDITKETKWMWQLAGNCFMSTPCRHARLHVNWACGEYKFGPPKPEYYTYLLEFSERELKEFWQNVVLRNRDSVKPEEGQG